MKIKIAVMLLSIVLLPDLALAKQMHATAPTGKARAEQYAKMLKWCQQKWSNGQGFSVEWGSHYGKTTWWCLHR